MKHLWYYSYCAREFLGKFCIGVSQPEARSVICMASVSVKEGVLGAEASLGFTLTKAVPPVSSLENPRSSQSPHCPLLQNTSGSECTHPPQPSACPTVVGSSVISIKHLIRAAILTLSLKPVSPLIALTDPHLSFMALDIICGDLFLLVSCVKRSQRKCYQVGSA
jgi:hypothetical protein